MKKILLKNGEIVSSGGIEEADLLLTEGKIEAIYERGGCDNEDVEEIDCPGKLILPGLIDVHVHFREPGAEYKEDFESGSAAAVSGGVTTVCDMPNNTPPILTLADLEMKKKLIQGRSYTNYRLYIGYNGENINEINRADGVAGVKIFCANSTGNMGIANKFLEDAFREISYDKLLVFHAEDEACISRKAEQFLAEFQGREDDIPASIHSKIRASECAVKMVRELCEFAKRYERPIHIAHVSLEEEIDIISQYRHFGVTCEVTPHHLTLSEDDYDYFGNFIRVNPPVRSRDEIFGVWKALKAGLIDIIATDHAPHTKEEKEQSYLKALSGIPGVEMVLPILLNTVNNEGMEIEEVVKLCCERPAEIFDFPTKGKIEEGYDADLVVVDMDKEKKFEDSDVVSKCGWSPYSGSLFQGWPVMTFVNGKMVFIEGEILSDCPGVEV